MKDNLTNCIEGCNLPSSPNDIKYLLGQIKKEVDYLVKNTEAKLLIHDGKIAEVCRYIKDNLSNTLRCMLLDMKLKGELDTIINEVLVDVIDKIKVDSINVKDFGAIGDGETDNTLAFTEVFNLANKLKKNIYIPAGKYVISRDLPSLYSGVEIYGDNYTNRIDHGSIIIDKRTTSTYLIKIEDYEGKTIIGGGIKNISFIYEGGGEVAHCISLGKGSGWVGVYENVKIYAYPGTAIKSLANDHRFINCSISSCSSKDNYAIYLTGTCNENKLIGCHIEHSRYVIKVDEQAFLNSFSNGKIEMSTRDLDYTELSAPISITSIANHTPMSFYNSSFINLDLTAYSNESDTNFNYNSVPAMINSTSLALIVDGCSFTVGSGSGTETIKQAFQSRFINAVYGTVTNNQFTHPSYKVSSVVVYCGVLSNNNFLISGSGVYNCKPATIEAVINNTDCIVKSVGNNFYGKYAIPYTYNNEDYQLNTDGKIYGSITRNKTGSYTTLVIAKNHAAAELFGMIDIHICYLGTRKIVGRFTIDTYHTYQNGDHFALKDKSNIIIPDNNPIYVSMKNGNYYIQFLNSNPGIMVRVDGIKGQNYTAYVDTSINELITDYDRRTAITNS